MIVIRAHGPPEITVDGRAPPPEVLWRKHLALLLYLAYSPRGRSRDHLVGLLWPDKDDPKARHSLNEALRAVRKVAGATLSSDGDQIRLSPEALRLEDAPEDPLNEGEFLEGFTVPDAPEFDDWLSRERETRRRRQLERLQRAGESALARGDLDRARSLAEHALALYAHHEPALRVLLRALALAGDRTLALSTFESWTEALERELSAAPEPATLSLVRQIRDRELMRGRPVAERESARVPLVGPACSALEKLSDLWDEVKAENGTSRMALVVGDPGTGRTRLAEELAARARLDGALVVWTRVRADDDLPRYWTGALRGGLASPGLAGAAAGALAALAELDPDLAVRFPSARGAPALPLPVAAAAAIGAVADRQPTLLVAEDVHQASADVLRALEHITSDARQLRLALLLTTHRPPWGAGLDALASRVGRDLPGSTISLEPFDGAVIDQLIRWALPNYGTEQRARTVRRILADSAGNPFLAVELVRAVHHGLALGEPAPPAEWPAALRTLDQTLPSQLPESVRAALRLRYRMLPEPAQRTLTAVAVLGGDRPIAALARAVELGTPEVERALDLLEWERWLVGDDRGYNFVTRLAREVLLADMVTGGLKRRLKERADEVSR